MTKLPNFNIPVPTIGEKPKPTSTKNKLAHAAKQAAKDAAAARMESAYAAKQAAKNATVAGMKGAEKFKGVFALDKKFSRGGKVYK